MRPQKRCPSYSPSVPRAGQSCSTAELVCVLAKKKEGEMTHKTTLQGNIVPTKEGLLRKVNSDMLGNRDIGQEHELA